ncbi:class I SAM-dependent methyltransferase [Rhodoferax sp.]|uniref:class I SAM-dependent methyltransferase n=1 Tax=Rhodoferax sp. TaxID=50421 RepID=UPI00374C9E19
MQDKSHWERVYSTKSSSTLSWYQTRADQSLGLIQRIDTGERTRIIDVGGGTSMLADDLLGLHGVEVTVLDISESALEVARQRLASNARRVQWLVGDITQLALPAHAYDIWHDRAVFHFMTTLEQRQAYVAQVRRAVRPGGHVIVAVFGPDGPLQCSGLPVMRYAPDALHAQFGDAFELVEHASEAHRTPAGVEQQFVYCHCVVH